MTQSKGPRLLRVLKLLGLLAAFLLLYPLCYLAWFLRGEASVPHSLLGEVAVIVCGFCGAGLRTLLDRRKHPLPAGNILLLLAGILLSLAVFFLFGANLLPGLPLAVSCLAAFLVGDRMTLLPYDTVATRAFSPLPLSDIWDAAPPSGRSNLCGDSPEAVSPSPFCCSARWESMSCPATRHRLTF